MYWPFVVLYLRWETHRPDEWRSRDSNLWSPWTRKEVVLRELGRSGLSAEMRPDAVDLLLTALQRPYRCKDWMYALVVRHVADPDFHDRVTALTRAPDPVARLVLDLVDHPEWRVTRKTWRRWLEDHRAQPLPPEPLDARG